MALSLALALLALIAPASGLTEKELADALSGKVPLRSEFTTTPSGKSAGRSVGAIVINRPIAEIWMALTRFEDKPEYIPRLRSVEILEKSENRLRVRQVVDATLKKVRYTLVYSLDEAQHQMHFSLDHSVTDNGIKDADGEYRVFELDAARSLIVYRTWIDTGLAVPQFIQRYLSSQSVPNLLRAIRKRVESGGTYKQ